MLNAMLSGHLVPVWSELRARFERAQEELDTCPIERIDVGGSFRGHWGDLCACKAEGFVRNVVVEEIEQLEKRILSGDSS